MNGQIDNESELVPSISTALNTYRGEVEGSCLENKEWLMSIFCPTMFKEGHVPESLFNAYSIPEDTKLDGSFVTKDATISQENRQHAKVLSSQFQINERKKLIHSKKMKQFQKQTQLYDSETAEYECNHLCEQKLLKLFLNTSSDNNHVHDLTNSSAEEPYTFSSICGMITDEMIQNNHKCLLNNEMKSFIQVRVGEPNVCRGRLSYRNVLSNKSDVVVKLMEVIAYPVTERYFTDQPLKPVLDIHSDTGLVATGRSDIENCDDEDNIVHCESED